MYMTACVAKLRRNPGFLFFFRRALCLQAIRNYFLIPSYMKGDERCLKKVTQVARS